MPEGAAEPHPMVQPVTVAALLDLVWRLLEAEREREGSFNLRGVAVVAFAGVIVTLSSSSGRAAVLLPLAQSWVNATLVLFGVSIACLLAAVTCALLGVLLPRESIALSAAEIQRYPTMAAVSRNVEDEQGRALRGLVEALTVQRDRTTRKARWLRACYYLLIVAVTTIAAFSFILVFGDAGLLPLDPSAPAKASGS